MIYVYRTNSGPDFLPTYELPRQRPQKVMGNISLGLSGAPVFTQLKGIKRTVLGNSAASIRQIAFFGNVGGHGGHAIFSETRKTRACETKESPFRDCVTKSIISRHKSPRIALYFIRNERFFVLFSRPFSRSLPDKNPDFTLRSV